MEPEAFCVTWYDDRDSIEPRVRYSIRIFIGEDNFDVHGLRQLLLEYDSVKKEAFDETIENVKLKYMHLTGAKVSVGPIRRGSKTFVYWFRELPSEAEYSVYDCAAKKRVLSIEGGSKHPKTKQDQYVMWADQDYDDECEQIHKMILDQLK
jgi:hypothetical protein